MSSAWNHVLCDDCWVETEGDRPPLRLKYPTEEVCCRCRENTTSGIYYRADPNSFSCGGNHEDPEPDIGGEG
jgi:hypothetical protein